MPLPELRVVENTDGPQYKYQILQANYPRDGVDRWQNVWYFDDSYPGGLPDTGYDTTEWTKHIALALQGWAAKKALGKA